MATAAAVVTGSIIAGFCDVPAGRAEAQSAAKPLSFDVASIKPLDQTWTDLLPVRSGGRVSWKVDLSFLIQYAYHLQGWRISTLPPHASVYQIDATTDTATTEEDQLRLMFQTLLADRFKMTTHRITKEMNGYVLTITKSGFALTEVKPGDTPAPPPEWFHNKAAIDASLEGKVLSTFEELYVQAIVGRRVPISKLAGALQQPLGTFVLDKTGLLGNYYFGFRFARADAPADVDAPSLSSAVQELGLRLEKQKGPVETLIIDHIEKTPTKN